MTWEVKLCKPESVGWLRTPEHDTPSGGKAYEMPNGFLFIFPAGARRVVPKRFQKPDKPDAEPVGG